MKKVRVKVEGVEETIRKLKKLDNRIKKKILKKVARESLKPMVASYKANIRNADEVFKVYKNGKIYVEIQPGQLKNSVGVKFPRKLNKGGNFGASVGPRRSGTFKQKDKGGWYAGMLNFGWLQVGKGKDYAGSNRGFAQRAMAGAKSRVQFKFVRTFKVKVEQEIKKLKFGQRAGLR